MRKDAMEDPRNAGGQERSPAELLTDVLLGEATAAEEARLEAALAADPELAARRDELQSLLAALAPEGAPAGTLAPERRAVLRQAAGSAGRPRFRFRPIWGGLAAAAAALLWAGVHLWPGGGWSEAPAVEYSAAARRSKIPASAQPFAKRAPATAGRAPGRDASQGLAALGYAGGDDGVQAYTQEQGQGAAEGMDLLLGDATALPGEGAAPGRVDPRTAGAPVLALVEEAGEAPPAARPDVQLGLPAVAAPPPAAQEATREAQDRRARYRSYDQAEERLRMPVQRKLGQEATPDFEVVDGYGRHWRGRHVLEHLRPHGREAPRDMFFRFYGDNPFVLAEEDAVSTFAADVDTASFALSRNYLRRGLLPPREAVRTEEFVNAMPRSLAPPEEEDLVARLRYAPSRYGHGPRVGLLEVAVRARAVPAAERQPLSLVFVVDSSGSMARENRLGLVRRALQLVVDQLGERDTVAIVAFAEDARLVLPATPASRRWEIREALDGLAPGGSTNAEAGLTLGYALAERGWREGAVNRVVLCSDGVANTGETDQARILEKVAAFRERQVDLTTIGVGMGNHNDVFLEQLADAGDGSCHYVDDYEEARRVFLDEFTGTFQVVARDLKIQVEFDPAQVLRWRLLGYENRALPDAAFRDDTRDAGEVGAGQGVVALYEIEETGRAARRPLAQAHLRWRRASGDEVVERSYALLPAERRRRWEELPAGTRLVASAAQLAEFLRRSYWARGDSLADLETETEALARALPGETAARDVLEMVRAARPLLERLPAPDDRQRLVEELRQDRLQAASLRSRASRAEDASRRLEELERRGRELEAMLAGLLAGAGDGR